MEQTLQQEHGHWAGHGIDHLADHEGTAGNNPAQAAQVNCENLESNFCLQCLRNKCERRTEKLGTVLPLLWCYSLSQHHLAGWWEPSTPQTQD